MNANGTTSVHREKCSLGFNKTTSKNLLVMIQSCHFVFNRWWDLTTFCFENYCFSTIYNLVYPKDKGKKEWLVSITFSIAFITKILPKIVSTIKIKRCDLLFSQCGRKRGGRIRERLNFNEGEQKGTWVTSPHRNYINMSAWLRRDLYRDVDIHVMWTVK